MKKKLSLLMVALLGIVAFATASWRAPGDPVTIYSWESPDGTVVETGGTAVHKGGKDGDPNRVNFANASYYTICLNGKSDFSTDYIQVDLAEGKTLHKGDIISITAYRNKNDNNKQSGALDDDGTIPDDAVEYVASDPTAKTLNPNTTTQVRQNEDINPIALVLEFPVDIWRIYINNVLAAWAYSPGVSANGAIYASTGENGVIIEPKSKTEATVVFNPANMQTGSSEIAAAFVPNAAKPTQEIGRTKLADVNITSSTTSPDEEIQGVGDSGGGCSAGLGAIVSAIAAAFFISKKRS